MSVEINVAEVHRLAVDLGKASAGVTSKASKLVDKTLKDIEDGARRRVHKRSGTLAASISHASRGLTGEVGPTAHYAPFPEYGTAYQASRPYMWPATDAARKAFDVGMEKIAEVNL